MNQASEKKVLSTVNTTEEKWRPVIGYENIYDVSSIGRIRSISKPLKRKKRDRILIHNRILKPSVHPCGYRQVVLSKNKKQKTLRVHRIVAMAFIQNENNLPFVNHKDGNTGNNIVENLEWCTPKENTLHSYRELGRIPIHGETHNKAKLSNKDVIEIRRKYVPYKYSFDKLGKEFRVDPSAIYLIIKGKNWKYL